MNYVDTSALYHIVRGHYVIKLYVIYNMLEVRGHMTQIASHVTRIEMEQKVM